MSPCDIYDIFNELGRINVLRQRNSRHLIYTISMQCTNLSELRRQCEITAENHNMTLVWLHGDEQQENLQPNPDQPAIESPLLDQQSEHHTLNALVDNCLREIFESSVLSLWDLLSLANVCKRFNRIAKQAFSSKYVDHESNFDDIELWRMKEFFRTFGELITTIDLAKVERASCDIVVRMMLEHCTKVTNLKCKVHEPETIVAMCPLMKSIESLTIECSTDNFPELFDPNTAYPMKHLALHSEKCSLPAMNFPHLEQLYLYEDEYDRNQWPDDPFFALNPQIKVLKLYILTFNFGIEHILRHLPNLAEFDMGNSLFGSPTQITMSSAQIFAQLEHLKILRTSFYLVYADTSGSVILEALCNGQVELEQLSVKDVKDVGRDTNAICRMKSIKQLELDRLDDTNLLRMVRELEHLERIQISYADSFEGICDALKDGKQLTDAEFKLIADSFEISIDRRILEEIDTMRQDRQIRLNVELTVYNRSLDTYPVEGVR